MPVDESQSGAIEEQQEFDLMPLVNLSNLADVVSGTLQGEYIGAFDWCYYSLTNQDYYTTYGSNLWEHIATLIPAGEDYIILGGSESSVYLLWGDGIIYNEDTYAITGRANVTIIEHSWGDVAGADRLDFPLTLWKCDYGELNLNLTAASQWDNMGTLVGIPFGSFDGMMHLDTQAYNQTYMLGLIACVVLVCYLIGSVFRWVYARK